MPVNAAKAFIAQSGVAPNVEGEFNRYYRAALDDASAGEWTSARTNLAIASRLFPNSPDLIRFNHEAERAITHGSQWSPRSVKTVVAGSLGFVAIVGTIALAAGSRGQRAGHLRRTGRR